MKKLKLTPQLTQKLNKLDEHVNELSYLGVDINLLLSNKFVAIVGTRKPTTYGKELTEKITQQLSREGVVIISGLALGIDSIAHKACLESGGKTIAVLPSGLSNIYPASHRLLAKQIIDSGGSLISEYPQNHKPRKVEFLERNRIIAALSDAVVIPEAAGNSGSLNTANHAIKMEIPLYAVPGSVYSPMSAGTNFLLKSKAKAITDASDLTNILGIKHDESQQKLDLLGENDFETLILQKISKGISDQDNLQTETSLHTAELQTHLTMLEIQGKISQDTQGNWHLA